MALDLPGKLWLDDSLARASANKDATWLVPVWYYRPEIGPSGTEWFEQHHVDDPETFIPTVDAALQRRGSKYALWCAGPPETSQWALRRVDQPGSTTTRHYKHREAAEMVAIHNG